jgi:hypothetical protein
MRQAPARQRQLALGLCQAPERPLQLMHAVMRPRSCCPCNRRIAAVPETTQHRHPTHISFPPLLADPCTSLPHAPLATASALLLHLPAIAGSAATSSRMPLFLLRPPSRPLSRKLHCDHVLRTWPPGQACCAQRPGTNV